MNKHEKQSRELHKQGNNCSYSVYTAFLEDTKLDGQIPVPRSIEGKCGAVLAAEKILKEMGRPKDIELFEKEFISEFKYLKCIDLMKAERKCNDYVGKAAEIVDEILKENLKDKDEIKPVLFVTANPSKSKRFSKGLLENGFKIITLEDIDKVAQIEENGKNAIENALIKARAYSKILDIPVFALDDNLYLENVPDEKQPGIYVRRVNGKRLTDEEMIEYYTKLVKEYGKSGKLNCRWVHGIAVINNGKESTYTWNTNDFYLVDKPSNKIHPGYPLDTISINKKLNKYFTDITEKDKELIHQDESDVVDFLVKNCKY